MPEQIILASSSPFRKSLLANAGIAFVALKPEIDERAVEAPLRDSGATPEDVALILAIAKATDVSERNPGALVIGSDQTLSLGDQIFHKPADMDAARRHLLNLSGRTHQLNSAVALVRDGQTLWSHIETARLTMRRLDPAFVGRYLAGVGDTALASVGAYQIEGPGIQLFEKIEGDYFTIVGLPLLPLLAALRTRGRSMAERSIQARPITAFVCGHPIAHSRSPMIHGHWLKVLWPQWQLPRDRHCAVRFHRLHREPAKIRPGRRQCHHSTQGDGVPPRRRPRRGRGTDRRRQHALARRRQGPGWQHRCPGLCGQSRPVRSGLAKVLARRGRRGRRRGAGRAAGAAAGRDRRHPACQSFTSARHRAEGSFRRRNFRVRTRGVAGNTGGCRSCW